MHLEDYALIGDCETVALVGRNGSIDWLCWPSFASPACLARLLGTGDNGFWKIAPAAAHAKSTRRYEPHSLVLETTWSTASGSVQVLDFMPPRESRSCIVRIVKGLRGAMRMRGELALRFDYGETIPWVTRITPGIRAVAGPNSVELHTTAPMKGEGLRTVSEFTVRAGESIPFVLSYGSYGDYAESAAHISLDVGSAYRQTGRYWQEWTARCGYRGAHRELVERSLITLKALTFRPTGGIVAAPTTSLPESIGGVRNWDYRYCWLRDTTFTLLALTNAGYHEEAGAWMRWLRRTVAGSPAQIQIMYGILGERTLIEWEVPYLPGYERSKPVRVGNAASSQVQLDIYGELLDAFFWTDRAGGESAVQDFDMLSALIDHLETIWRLPDEGIWEMRGGPRHFTYSKVMAWVAFDRAIRLAESHKLSAPLARWRRTRSAIHAEVCRKAFSKRLNSFTQFYGSSQLDASALLIGLVGFLPPEDPRIRGTVEAVERHLMRDGFVMRYKTSQTKDGLPGGEGNFLACSFWLVSSLKLLGREADAIQLFERLISVASDVGLLSEEYDTRRKRLVGNFPQAFSHIALLNAAYHLAGSDDLKRHAAGKSTARDKSIPSDGIRPLT